jgi:hypothetical protein
MSVGLDTVVKQVRTGQIFPDILNFVSSISNFNQGDVLIFDTSTNLIRGSTAEADDTALLGIASQDIVNGIPRSPYQGLATTLSQQPQAINGPTYGDVFAMILATGSTLTAGQQIYGSPSTGTRGVASSGTFAIGVYQGAAVSSSAAGLVVNCLIGSRYPNNVLKF